MGKLQASWRFLSHLFHEWNAHNVPRLAASLAYYASISMAPLLVIVVGVIDVVFGKDAARQYVLDQVCEQIGPQAAKVVEELLGHIAAAPGRGGLATILGLIVIFFGASAVFHELRDSLNTIWRAHSPAQTGWKRMVKSRLIAFVMVLATGFLLILSVAVSTFLAAAGKYLERWDPGLAWTLKVADPIVSVLLATLMFALIYRFVPDETLPWRHVLTGAATTAVLFVAGKIAIGLYIGKAGVGSAYGAAGSLIAFLVWIYYSSQVFLIGAILTHALARKERVTNAIAEHSIPLTMPRSEPRQV